MAYAPSDYNLANVLATNEPQAYKDLYSALQSGKASIGTREVNLGGYDSSGTETQYTVLDASGKPIEGVSVDPTSGRLIVPSAGGYIHVNTPIGQGGTLAPISDYQSQVGYQGGGNFFKETLQNLAPVIGMAGAAFGLPGILGGALNSAAGLGLNAAGQAALGGAITGGGLAGLTGQNVLKGALLGGGLSYAGNALGGAGSGPGYDPNNMTAVNPADFGGGIDTLAPGYNPSNVLAANPADFGSVDTVPSTTRGYYDEGGQFVPDPNGPLQGPLDNTSGANLSSMDGYTYDPNTRTWTAPDGSTYTSTTGMHYPAGATGADIFKSAGIGDAGTAGAAGAASAATKGLTASGALSGLAAIKGLLALTNPTTGVGGGGGGGSGGGAGGGSDGFSPVGGYTFNPAAFQAAVPDPTKFRPTEGVVTVSDAIRQAAARQAAERPLKAMAEGGQAQSNKPVYTPRAKLAVMSPWERAAAQLNNAAYAARMPVGMANPQTAVTQLGQFAAGGGISDLGSYSDGGRMLKGAGDGMSDSIPATIGGKRPARLADGEFVVPADVVSGLGNGSTDAGAKQLYKMMDRVRQSRTGTKKQGREINPGKLMPV